MSDKRRRRAVAIALAVTLVVSVLAGGAIVAAQTDDGNETDGNETDGLNETQDENETDAGLNETENETEVGMNETENETDAGLNETENETDAGLNETENETDAGENETEAENETAAQNETAAEEDETAYLRIAHFAPDAGQIDVIIDNETVLSEVGYDNVSEYQTVEPGENEVTINSSEDDTVIYEDEIETENGTAMTIAASAEEFEEEDEEADDYEPEVEVVTFEDEPPIVGTDQNLTADTLPSEDGEANETEGLNETENETEGLNETENETEGLNETEDGNETVGDEENETMEDGNETTVEENETNGEDEAPEQNDSQAAVRVVHLSPDASNIDVTLEDDDTVLADNLTYHDDGDYVNLTGGDYTVEVRMEGDNEGSNILETFDVTVENGTAYSAFVHGYDMRPESYLPGLDLNLTNDTLPTADGEANETAGMNETENETTAMNETENETEGLNETENETTAMNETENETEGLNETENETLGEDENETLGEDNETEGAEDNETMGEENETGAEANESENETALVAP